MNHVNKIQYRNIHFVHHFSPLQYFAVVNVFKLFKYTTV